MASPNFPSTGLVPNETKFTVGALTYLWDGEKWRTITAKLSADQITYDSSKTVKEAIDSKLDNQLTTTQLINQSVNLADGKSIRTNGFYVDGDGGGAQWVKTSDTGTPSQTPAQLGDAKFTDASGNVWDLVNGQTVYYNGEDLIYPLGFGGYGEGVYSYNEGVFDYIPSGNANTILGSFSELSLMSPSEDGESRHVRFICPERANAEYLLQPSGYVALAGDVTFANGRVAALQLNGSVYVEMFGAIGTSDDVDYIQDAIDRTALNGGGNVYAFNYYKTSKTITIDGGSVALCGAFIKKVFSATVSTRDAGVIYADFTDGPAVLISDGGCEVKNLTIKGSPTRRAATITTGAQNSNSGILIEPDDTPSDILQSVTIENVRCVSHPSDGLSVEGDVTNAKINNFYSNDLGRHGISITDGALGGRANKKVPGIILIERGKSFDTGGHGLAVGHPSSTQFPYRITVLNREAYRNALNPTVSYSTASNFVVAQDSDLTNCAFGGTTTGNVADHEVLEIGGRDIRVAACRYISCLNRYVKIRQQSGLSTLNIEIDGGTAVSVGVTVADFATIAAGADGVSILRVTHDCTNPITSTSYTSYNSDVTLHDIAENKTIRANHTIDVSAVTVTGLKGSGLKTISSGAVVITKDGYYTIDTESSAASDDLTNITGATAGAVIIIRQSNSSRVVTVTDGTGNIRLAGGSSLALTVNTCLTLLFDGTNWQEASRSIN